MFEELIENLKKHSSVALGFSGGVDSSLLAYGLKSSGIPYCCVTVQTCFQSEREIAQSVCFCSEFGIRQQVLPLELPPAVLDNPPNRCYLCKTEIFGAIEKYAKENGYATVMDGSQRDDERLYRPGRQAIEERGVVSPLLELGWGKDRVRQVSREAGLPTAQLEAAPCLATRVPYGNVITEKILGQIQEAEKLLRADGLCGFRCRHHGQLLRVEAKDTQRAFALVSRRQAELRRLGFAFVTLDVAGYQRGCYDENH